MRQFTATVFLCSQFTNPLLQSTVATLRRVVIMSSAQNPISIDDDDSHSVVDLTDEKPAAKKTKFNDNVKHAAKPPKVNDVIPVRLFNTKQSMGSTQYTFRPPSIKKYFQTLRETIGFDGSSNERRFQWLIVANYLFDVHFFLQETLPDILSFKRVVVFYGEGVTAEGTAYWQSLLQGSGNTVEFVRIVPSDPPRSRTNPLDIKIQYGVHHTKMFLVGYDERKQYQNSNNNWQSKIRVVVHTANMVQQDVEWKSQGLYSQDFPLKSSEENKKQQIQTVNPYASSKKRGWPYEDDDPQPFEDDLVTYLESYCYSTRQSWFTNGKEMSLVNLVREYDFSSAYAVLIPSIPGKHSSSNAKNFGYMKLQRAIKEHVLDYANPDSKSSPHPARSPIICQFSSMGSLSPKWLHDFISAIDIHSPNESEAKSKKSEATSIDKVKLIWPTVEEIRTSVEGYQGGGSVPGTSKNVNKDFLVPLYHRWSKPGAEYNSTVDPLRMTKNVPHIKTFLQLSDSISGEPPTIEWLCLTSHNLSKAAWGEYQNSAGSFTKVLFIRHYELGVFISPATLAKEALGDERDYKRLRIRPYIGNAMINTPINIDCDDQNGRKGTEDVAIPLPYDVIDPERYGNGDVPWTVDGPGKILPDSFGRIAR